MMRTSVFLAAAAGLLTAITTTAIPVKQKRDGVPDFQVTDITTSTVPHGNTSVSFTVYDPDQYTNQTQSCAATWKTGSKGYPQSTYAICGNGTTLFGWNMASFTNIRSFQVEIQHTYEDPLIGQYPYDYITNYATANVTEAANLDCTGVPGHATCKQKSGNIIYAPITESCC